MGRVLDEQGFPKDEIPQETMMDGSSPLEKALTDIDALQGVSFDGKGYIPTKDRLAIFRRWFPGYSITTQVVQYASVLGKGIVIRASITDKAGKEVASGHSECVRGDGAFGSAAPLESAETKAIGRALAVFGLSGREFASADELAGVAAKAGRVGSGDDLSWENIDRVPRNQDVEYSGASSSISMAAECDRTDLEFSEDMVSHLSGPSEEMEESYTGPGKGWSAVKDGLLMAVRIQESADELSSCYELNKQLLYEMKKKHPDLHQEIMSAFTARKKQLKDLSI